MCVRDHIIKGGNEWKIQNLDRQTDLALLIIIYQQ